MSCTKGECPCGVSSDAFATYDDGGSWCFRCKNKDVPKEFKGTTRDKPAADPDDAPWSPFQGWTETLKARGITEETCKRFSYQLGRDGKGNLIHIQNIKEEGRLTARRSARATKTSTGLVPQARTRGSLGRGCGRRRASA
jgi:hypothetical protein